MPKAFPQQKTSTAGKGHVPGPLPCCTGAAALEQPADRSAGVCRGDGMHGWAVCMADRTGALLPLGTLYKSSYEKQGIGATNIYYF